MVVMSYMFAFSSRPLPHGSRGPPRSPPSRLLVAKSLVDVASKLEGEANVLYPKLHSNPENYIKHKMHYKQLLVTE